MSKLELNALSGGLTKANERDFKNEPEDISDVEDDHSRLTTTEELDKFLNVSRSNTQVTQGSGSQTMSRGWSGNTGPKGVLLDFKASHGKSGAILGGNGPTTSSTYSRQTIGSKSPMIAHSRPRLSSSPASESGFSDGERDPQTISLDNPLYDSTKTTTRLTLNPPNRNNLHHHSASSASAGSNANLKVDPSGRKLFGHLREVGVENFIQAIEAEKDDSETVVLVHLYDPALESCVVLNNHLSNLARAHPRTKFLRALASEVDFFSGSTGEDDGTMKGFKIPSVKERSSVWRNRVMNLMDDDPFADEDSLRSEDSQEEEASRRATDSDVLPTLIWYRSGQYVQSLPALESQMPRGSIVRGEQGCKDLEVLLKRNGVIITS